MDYKHFKAELASLCERGQIAKETKKLFSHYNDDTDPGTLIYKVCSDLFDFLQKAPQNSAEYAILSGKTAELVLSAGEELTGFSRDIAVVCAYIKLSALANTGDEKAFSKLTRHAAEYNESLNNIKYGLPLF